MRLLTAGLQVRVLLAEREQREGRTLIEIMRLLSRPTGRDAGSSPVRGARALGFPESLHLGYSLYILRSETADKHYVGYCLLKTRKHLTRLQKVLLAR